jgi:hypothetical protein
LAATLARALGSFKERIVAARRLAVAVLPTPLAPSRASAGNPDRASSSVWSITVN